MWLAGKSASHWKDNTCAIKLWRPSPGVLRWWLPNHFAGFWHDGRQSATANQKSTLVLQETVSSPTLVHLKSNQSLTLVALTGIQIFALLHSSFMVQSDSGPFLIKIQPDFDSWKFCMALLRVSLFSGLESGQRMEWFKGTVRNYYDWFNFRVSGGVRSLLYHKATQRGSQR